MDIIPFEQLPSVINEAHRNEYAYNLYLIANQNLAELESTHRLTQIQKAKASRMMSMIENSSDEDYLHWSETYHSAQAQLDILDERILLARKSKGVLLSTIDSLGGLDVVRQATLTALDSKLKILFGGSQ